MQEDIISYEVCDGIRVVFCTVDKAWAQSVAQAFNHYYCDPCKPHRFTIKPINNDAKRHRTSND